MYAIVDISGKQFKVEKNKYIYTDKIDPKSGKKVEFDNVLFKLNNQFSVFTKSSLFSLLIEIL